MPPMWSWFQREILDSGRLPLAVCFAAYLVTFITTRTITRIIRSGRGPFKDNVSSSGLHIHHAVPGVILLVVGAFIALSVDLDSAWSIAAGVLVGVGTSLVLDEFALILHLQDVYWSNEGRLSVEIAGLAAACLGLLLVVGSPFAVDKGDGLLGTVVATSATILVHLTCIGICLMKGKYKMALFGILVPFLAAVSAMRLARPGSRWAGRRYSPEKMQRAATRAARHDERWGPITGWVEDFIAGMPAESTPPSGPSPASSPVSSPASPRAMRSEAVSLTSTKGSSPPSTI
jgi:hypothetical protein